MTIKTAYSTNGDPALAALELADGLAGLEPSFVLFFASAGYSPEILGKAIAGALPGAVTAGCTTAGEIVSGKMLKGSVVAMAFSREAVPDVKVEVLPAISAGPGSMAGLNDAFASFERHFGEPVSAMDHTNYVGIVLVDGLSRSEERIMDRIGDLTNVTFIGGSAGDDLAFRSTWVFANGEARTDSAVLALLKPGLEFDIIKTQSFRPTGKTLKATRVNEAEREVAEFDGKPAAVAYAEAVGKSVDESAGSFMSNPVGLMVGNEPYVRSPQRFNGDKLVFYCNVLQGMELAVLESTDIVAETKQAVDEKLRNLGRISGIVNFNCILRTLELEAKDKTREYGEIFASIPTIGFSTYGEEYIGHINQTATMLVFK